MNVIDLFAGGGGASEGIRQALGVSPALAINHDPAAIAMHAENHPESVHLTEDLFRVRPGDHKPRRGQVDLLWASPDCTHHSRAKGGKPRLSGRRLLAWVVVEWARDVHPKVIILENVPEFAQWGPLDSDGNPVRAQAGETFREFLAALALAGYRVEHRTLNAADYGAPTARKRLFLVARSDGEAIRWPEPTHGPGRALPWRTAAECIDWSIPVPSIFDRERPLAEATQRRIAAGVKRFVLDSPRPFIVRYQGERRAGEQARVFGLDEALPTVTGQNRFGLVVPNLVRTDMQSDGRLRGLGAADEPVRTITTSGGHAVVASTLIQTGYGERRGQAPRVLDLEAPLGTVVAGGQRHGLVAAFLAKHNGGPIGAIGQELGDPCHTITGVDSKSLVTTELGTQDTPRARQVAAFLCKYYGTGAVGQRLDEPLHTVRTGDCFGLVTVAVEGETYIVADIGMRMLQPRELATAQGFDADYILTGSKRQQVARIGNSVCPPVARAIVEAQFGCADPLEAK